MNQSLFSRISRVVVLPALLAALIGVAGGAGAAHAASPRLACASHFCVDPAQPTMQAQAGQTVKMAITLRNISMLPRQVYLGVNGSTNWPLQLSTERVLLPEAESIVVSLAVNVPPAPMNPLPSASGADHITLKVSDNQSTVYTDLYVLVLATQAPSIGVAGGAGGAHAASPCLECRPQFTVTAGQTTAQAQPGQTVKIAVKLHNRSLLLFRNLALGVGDSMNWPLALSSQNVLLQPGETAQVILAVTVPPALADPPPSASGTDHITLKVGDNQDTIYTDLYVMVLATQ